MFKKALMKISVIGIVGAAFAACGVVDVEQAQGVVDLRARILEIQTNEVDPLVEQINAIEEQVAPIEAEIEALERQKEGLYQQAEEIGQEFDQEMRERFDTVYMEGDQARDEYKEQIDARFQELEQRQRDLKDEKERLHDELEESIQQRRSEMEENGQNTWQNLEFAMRAKEEEAQNISKGMWREWDEERDEAHRQVEDMRREYEENNPFNQEMEAIHQAWKDIDDSHFEIDIEQMQIEESRMELHDMVRPLEEEAEELRKRERDIWDTDPNLLAAAAGTNAKSSEDLIQEEHEKLEDLYRQLRSATDSEQQAQAVTTQLDWDNHAVRTDQIWADYDQDLQKAEEKRHQSFDANAAVGDANNAQLDIDQINLNYQDQIAYNEAKLDQAKQSLQDLEAGSTNDSAAQRSQIIADIEGKRSQLDQLHQNLATMNSVLQSQTRNNEWDQKTAAIADAESALANTPQFEVNTDGTVASDQARPEYANALSVVEALKNERASIPEYIVTEAPNPAYNTGIQQQDDLNVSISQLESTLNGLSDQSTTANPAYTAALAEKNGLEQLIGDLHQQRDNEIQAKQNIVDAASTGAPDQNQLDAEVASLINEAARIRDERLTALDAEYTITVTATGGSTTDSEAIRQEINEVEQYISSLHESQDQGWQIQEQMAQDVRHELRELEDGMESIWDMMRELEDQQRPLQEQRMALDKERNILKQKQRDIEDQRGPWEEERQQYEDELWSGFDEWQRTRQREIEDQQEQMWDLVRVEMDGKRRDTENGMKQMWRDFDNEVRDSHKQIDRDFKDKRRAIEQERQEIEEDINNLREGFEEAREAAVQEIEAERDQLYEERMAPIEGDIAAIDEEIEAKFASIEGLYQQQEELAGQLEALEAQVRELDQEAEFGLLSVISGAIDNAEKLEQNPASLAGAAGVSLTDFLPSPPSRD